MPLPPMAHGTANAEETMHRRGFLMALMAVGATALWPWPGHAEPLKRITLRVDGMT